METSELSGWKQISTYLNVTPRTAQLWEALGLPISRRPGPRGTVFTTPQALDRWKSRGQKSRTGEKSPRRTVTVRLPIPLWHQVHERMEKDHHTMQIVIEEAVSLYLQIIPEIRNGNSDYRKCSDSNGR